MTQHEIIIAALEGIFQFYIQETDPKTAQRAVKAAYTEVFRKYQTGG